MDSKSWQVVWVEEVVEDFSKIDRKDAELITDKVENYLIQDPINLGRSLKGELRGFLRYRIGKYMVIYAVEEKKKRIVILRIGDRKEVYK